MSIPQSIGRVIGASVAPLTFLGSLLRRDRLFHPDGVVYRAEVQPIAQEGPLGQLAQRLAGTALVRLSAALWTWPTSKDAKDILGAAVRFRSVDELTPTLLTGDQDVLFATASSVPALLLSPFRTNVHDFLDNQYHSILPFSLEGAGKVYLRLVPPQPSPPGGDRRERLALAVAEGEAVLRLEILVVESTAEGGSEPWLPVAAIVLRERLAIDDDALTFDPGTAAMGLVPRGVLQWVRPLAYTASQIGRRLTRRGS